MNNVLGWQASCFKKKRYSTEKRAGQVIYRRQQEGAGYLRAYYCNICLGFHITHKKDTLK